MGFGSKLLGFLTPRNLQYLDRLLEVVTDKNMPVYKEFWAYFSLPFGTYAARAVTEAIGRLKALHQVVREYRGQ